MGTRRLKMTDVAERAGVSTATVARVIYDRGYVSSETREAVRRVVAELGYRPNAVARGLRMRRSSILGLVVSESDLNPFFSKVAHAVQVAALARGYTVISLNHNGSVEAEELGIQHFIDQQVSAIIFCAAMDPAAVRRSLAAGVPTIQVERRVATVGHSVLVDSGPGMRHAVAHLVQLGHRRIAYIGGAPIEGRSEEPLEEQNEWLRLDAFRTALSKAGQKLPQSFVRLGRYYPARGELPLVGDLSTRTLLSFRSPPTAVICGSDVFAAGALQALSTAGLRSPEDMSIVGFDDSLATWLTPPLSSIAQPMQGLGEAAIDLAVRALKGDDREMNIVLPTFLVLRSSTSSPHERGKTSSG